MDMVLLTELEELRQIRALQAAEIHRLKEEIRDLRRRKGQQESDGPMKGLKLALVAPGFRRQDYLATLEPLGAKISFYPSEDKIGRIDQGCAKAHGILFITTFTSHKVDAHLDALADRTGIPLRKLPFKGTERLREAALEMEPDMRAYKELLDEVKS